MLHEDKGRSKKLTQDVIDKALATAQRAFRCGIHTTLCSSPGALVFNQDIFLNVPLLADWQMLIEKREHCINETLCQANMRRRQHDYEIDQNSFETITQANKVRKKHEGAYNIEKSPL